MIDKIKITKIQLNSLYGTLGIPRDERLKQVLAKMLPDIILHNGNQLCWITLVDSVKFEGKEVKDSELLQLCWDIEEDMSKKAYYSNDLTADHLWKNYRAELSNICIKAGWKFGYQPEHASWQLKTIALAKVHNIPIE